MTAEPQADALYVLSDLHLAPAGEQCVFRAHGPLVALIDHIAAAPAPQWLLLNGDVFDFLQIPGYDRLSLPLAAARMQAILDALEREPPARNVVAALRRLTAAGHTLCCLPGNHDPELHLHNVQAVLAAALGSRQPFPPEADHWRLRVAGRTVLGQHGHAGDEFNAIGSARMLRAQAAGDDEVPLPPGSRLVCEVINPYRRARAADGRPRFPFVDLLPSDHAVVLGLLLLDPALAVKRLSAALGIAPAVLVRKAMLATGIGGKRLTRGPAETAPPDGGGRDDGGFDNGLPDDGSLDDGVPDDGRLGEDWLDALAETIGAAAALEADHVPALRLQRELEAYLQGHAPALPIRDGVPRLAGGGAVQRVLWRALAAALERGRDAFRPDAADALAQRAKQGLQGDSIAITGHTHAAKEIASPGGGVYLNTGTWLDLTPIPTDTGPEALDAWLDAIAEDRVPRWQGCPVAKVDATGAQLLHWTGDSLRPWREALPPA